MQLYFCNEFKIQDTLQTVKMCTMLIILFKYYIKNISLPAQAISLIYNKFKIENTIQRNNIYSE